MKPWRSVAVLASTVLLPWAIGCGGGTTPTKGGTPTKVVEAALEGKVQIDGSSTVAPVSEAVAEEFHKVHDKVNVTVGTSGTGGGFKRFVRGEIDIADASRPISAKEKEECAKNKIEYLELAIATDGLAVVVNPKNDWVDCITVEQLKMIWQPESTVKTWKDVDPKWPDTPIKLFGPGTDSGTFDFFTGVINGKEKACRQEFTASEDDNTLVVGIEAEKNALGYFGYAYFAENKARLKLLGVDGGKGCVSPSDATVIDGTYKPLSRPLYIYVNKASLKRPELVAFVKFYLDNAPKLVEEVKYVPLDVKPAQEALSAALEAAKKG